jgi:uncharacterized membrane protein YGL010W
VKTAQEWFDEYGVSHQNSTNRAIHWCCIPSIVFSLLGMLWAVKIPGVESVWANVASVFIAISLLYYLRLSWPLALGMVPVVAAMVGGLVALEHVAWAPLWQISLGIFVVAWIGQFIGHKIEGKKPSFLQDLQFLLIAPIYLLGHLYRRFGLRY